MRLPHPFYRMPPTSPLVAPAPAPPAHHIQALAYHPDKGIHEHIDPHSSNESLADGDTLLWLDITAPTDDDTALLGAEFGLHPLALEELRASHVRAKCDAYPEYYALVMFAVNWSERTGTQLREVVIYVGARYLITVHRQPFPEVDEVVRRWQANTAIHRDTIAAPFYSFADTLVDGYFPVVDRIADMIEDVEDRLFGTTPDDGFGPELFRVKRDLIALRRVVSGQRDALNVLMRQDVPLFPEGSMLYFQSVFDHLVRLVESIDTYRDLLSSAMDMRLSVISNRLNQVMKVLTVVSTILMSASLIAGIYGMNFVNMPELHMRYGYYGALGAMALVSLGLVGLFRRIKWL